MTNLRRRKALIVGDEEDKSKFLNDISNPKQAYILAVQLNLKQSLSIKQLSSETHFTRDEIRWIYRRFKEESENSIIPRDKVRTLFGHMFHGDTEHYADLIFNTFDLDQAGSITFDIFVRAMSILLRGDIDEKLEFIYPLYDPNRTGQVKWERVFYLVTVIDDLIGIEARPRLTRNERCLITDKIFQRFNVENRGDPIPKSRFLELCKNDVNIRSSIENMVASIKL